MTDTAHAADIREVPLEPGGTVEIQLTSSGVRLRGTDGNRVVVRTRGGEPIDDELRIESTPRRVLIRDGENGLRIGPLFLRSRGHGDLDIELPRTATVALRTLSGDVHADGIGGPSHWTSASGDLRIAVSAGPVSIESASGDAILDASAAVALTARTVSGDLRVRAPRLDTVNASTTSGDVRIEADLSNASGHTISSVSGDVEVSTASPVRVETATIAGDVRATGTHRSEGGRGRRTIVVGDGSVRVSIRTTSGDVELHALGTSRVAGRQAAAVLASPAAVPPMPSAPVPPAASVPATPPVAGGMPPGVPAAPVAPGADGAPVAPLPPQAPDRARVVAEAEAAPNLVRPAGTEPASSPVAATAPADPVVAVRSDVPGAIDDHEAARLVVLRALERGEIDVEAASARLESLEGAGSLASEEEPR